MKKIGKILFVAIFCFVLLFTAVSYADVGSFDRYDSGGSYSGSSYSGSSDYSGGSSGFFFIFGNPTVIIIILIVIIVINLLSKRKNVDTYQPVTINKSQQEYEDSTIAINNIKEIDPNFSSELFKSWAKEVYVKLQAAWSEKDWTQIRPFESNNLFEQHQKQLNEFINNKTTNKMERVSVTNAYITDFYEQGDKEFIKVLLKAVQLDYIIEDETGRVVAGNKYEDRHMKYTMIFERKGGVKTKQGEDKLTTTNCPSCGAPSQVTTSGQCQYCNSIITTGEHGWVLTNLEGSRDIKN